MNPTFIRQMTKTVAARWWWKPEQRRCKACQRTIRVGQTYRPAKSGWTHARACQEAA